jgi:mRNA-degrading endonuclease RelE of RelBE toxin-antitoxin system
MAAVELTPDAVRDIQALPTIIVTRIHAQVIPRLGQWPNTSGCKALRGALAGHYRLRTGDYRIQFRVDSTRRTVLVPATGKGKKRVVEKTIVEYRVIVERAGHRDGFYDQE